MRLAGKVVLVTGSTSGIGEAIARRCVAEGARVLVHGLERDLGEAVAGSLGEAAALHVDDLADPEAAPRLVEAALPPSAGSTPSSTTRPGWSAARSRRRTPPPSTGSSRSTSAPRCSSIRAALPELSRARGAVLNIGSINAWSGEPTFVAYSASKGALMTLTRNLGDTLHREHGVRVNQINPDWVLTENEKRIQERQGNVPDWYLKVPKVFAPAGRLILPEEIAAAAVYWIGDESRPISGSVVEMAQFPVIGRNPPKVIR